MACLAGAPGENREINAELNLKAGKLLNIKFLLWD